MIGLSLIVKNEEKNLSDYFLNFFKEFDSVVVIDTGSTDGTIALLQENNIAVISLELDKNDKCSLINARNLSISLNKEDWVLVLDADEHIDINAINKIKETLHIHKNNESIGGFFIPFFDYRFGEPFEDYKLCLLRRDIFFEGFVHANPQSFLRKKNLVAEMIEDIDIKHFPITFSKEKTELYIEQMLFGLELEKENARYLWFLGYSFYKNNNFSQAKIYLELSLNLLSKEYPVECINAGLVLTYLYIIEGDFKMANESLNKVSSFRKEMNSDFEVKINFRMQDAISEFGENIKNKDTKAEIYSFMY